MLAACAGVSFPYKYYGLAAATYEGGELLGPKPADDIPLTQCQPSQSNKMPCVVMLQPEFLAMKQDYLETKTELVNCQKPK